MPYIEGFVAAVPRANKEKYRNHANTAAPIFKEFGVTRMVENWGDDVPTGKINDLRSAVKAKADEEIVFSWFEYPSKEARDAANIKIREDPRMKEMGAEMPFDGMRMIFGGFASLYDKNNGGKTGYIDGVLIPVPGKNKEDFLKFAKLSATIMIDHGASRAIDAWGDDVPDGKVTDFRRALQAKDDEVPVFGWVEWPSKKARDEGWEKVMADHRIQMSSSPFDGKRMIFGGFEVLLD